MDDDQLARFIDVLEDETGFMIGTDQKRRIRERLAPCENTIPVRIAVALDASGNWSAIGWSDKQAMADDKPVEKQAVEDLLKDGGYDEGPVGVVWVTANVPLPQEAEVHGEVEG